MNIYYFILYIKIIILFILISQIIFVLFLNRSIIISIIIPTFNREKFIVKSVESVLNQTFNNIEIIIIDDCSNDNTQKVIKKIKDKRIKYIKLNQKKGASYARNIGIILAKGEFISFQDSDDIYHFDKLEKQLKNLYKSNSDFDFCKICVHYNKTFQNIYPKTEINIENLYNILVSKGNFISTQSILVKKKCLLKNLFDISLPRLQDYDLVLRLIPNLKVSFTNETLVELYRQNDSISLFKSKLDNSISRLLSKNYNFNLSQNKQFHNNLKRLKKIFEQ